MSTYSESINKEVGEKEEKRSGSAISSFSTRAILGIAFLAMFLISLIVALVVGLRMVAAKNQAGKRAPEATSLSGYVKPL